MKLYQTTSNAGAETVVMWSASAAGASRDRTASKKATNTEVGTKEVNVPTSKTGLLEWLNDNRVVVK